MKDKLLTIVVPSYNASSYLTEMMPTILSSKNIEDIELLIINDGSTDETREVAEKMEIENPSIVRVINKENGGHGSTINVGIVEAKGKYFKVVDADDWVDTENLDLLIEQLRSTNVDEILSPYYRVFMNGNKIEKIDEYNEFSNIEKGKIYEVSDFFQKINQTVGMHTITIKTEILKKNNIRLSEKMFYVDMEYITYPLPYIKTVLFFNKPIYKYRLGTSTQSVSMGSYMKNRDMHKKVIYNLVDFYNKLQTKDSREVVVKQLILNLISAQWEIYFSLEDSESGKKELIDFEKKLSQKNSYFTEYSKRGKIWVVRKTNFKLFNIMKIYSNWRKSNA